MDINFFKKAFDFKVFLREKEKCSFTVSQTLNDTQNYLKHNLELKMN